MEDLKAIEEFVVNTDDIRNLIDIYSARIKAYPDNRSYYKALALQCGEYYLASKNLGISSINDIVLLLFQVAKLLEEKGVTAEARMMENFTAEIHNIGQYIRNWFKEPGKPFRYESEAIPLLRNYIRQLQRMPVHPPEPNGQGIVEDPFDEMESLGDFVDSFLDDFDSAFDAITIEGSRDDTSASEGMLQLSDNEQTELEKLFLSISGAYIQPVKDFIGELRDGATSKEWVDICLGSIRLIEDAGTKMSLEKVTSIVKRFKDLMLMAKTSANMTISRDIRIQLLKEYATLTDLMPEAFATSDSHASRGSQRDSIIVNAILRKTPGIGPVSRNKLIAAGMNSLDKFFVANPKDLAAVSGLSESQASLLCRVFREYRESLAHLSEHTSSKQPSLLKIFKLIGQLKALHKQFREKTRLALYEVGHEDELNQLRLDRQRCMWEINIVMAELDAYHLVEDFRRMVYDRRIERIDEFIKAEASKHL